MTFSYPAVKWLLLFNSQRQNGYEKIIAMVIFRGFRGFSPLTRCIRGRDVSNAYLAKDTWRNVSDLEIFFSPESLIFPIHSCIIKTRSHRWLIGRKDAEALWKEGSFEQGIWTLLHIPGRDDGKIRSIGFARYRNRDSVRTGNLVWWCRGKKTSVWGLCEKIYEAVWESSISITGILREWDVYIR